MAMDRVMSRRSHGRMFHGFTDGRACPEIGFFLFDKTVLDQRLFAERADLKRLLK